MLIGMMSYHFSFMSLKKVRISQLNWLLLSLSSQTSHHTTYGWFEQAQKVFLYLFWLKVKLVFIIPLSPNWLLATMKFILKSAKRIKNSSWFLSCVYLYVFWVFQFTINSFKNINILSFKRRLVVTSAQFFKLGVISQLIFLIFVP